jgi:GntR family transcriptional repressor for pyruvate dehydrogenase complex
MAIEFTSIENRRAYRAIVDRICDAILRGDLQKGDRLPSEREIAAQSGLSRTSVREALKVLNDAGMVRMKTGGGGGTEIISDSIPIDLLGQAIEISRRRLLQFCETRNLMELSAASLAAARATPEQIDELEAVVTHMEKLVIESPEDRQAYITIDVDFHRLLMQCAHNEVLLETYTPILRQILQISDMVDVSEFHAYGLPSMQRFLKAVKNRNPMEARRAIDAHIQPLAVFFERSFEE